MNTRRGVLQAVFLIVLVLPLVHADQYLAIREIIPIRPWQLYLALTFPLLIYGASKADCRRLWRESRLIIIPFCALILIGFAGTQNSTIATRYRESMFAVLGLYTFLTGLTVAGWLRDRRLLSRFFLTAFLVSAASIGVDVVWPGTFSNNEARASGFGMNATGGPYICLLCLAAALSFELRKRSPYIDGLLLAIAFTAVYFTFARSALLMFIAIAGPYLVWMARKDCALNAAKAALVPISAAAALMVVISLAGSRVPLLKAANLRNAPLVPGSNSKLSERMDFMLGATHITRLSEREKLAHFYEEWSQQVGKKRPDGIIFPSLARENWENLRLLILYRTCELIARRPLVGWGTGFSSTFGTMKPHNQYAAKWLDNGVLGIAGYLWLLAALFAVNWRYRNAQGLLLTIALSFMGLFNQNCLESKAAFLPLAISLGLAIHENKTANR